MKSPDDPSNTSKKNVNTTTSLHYIIMHDLIYLSFRVSQAHWGAKSLRSLGAKQSRVHPIGELFFCYFFFYFEVLVSSKRAKI